MDPNEFPGSLGPLSLPDKPLIGDLPADMEFGEDLLASQTASVPQASALQPQDMEWEAPKQATSDSDVGLDLVKADGLSDISKPNSLGLDKSDPLAILEKPGILDSLSKEDELVVPKSEDLDSLYKADGSVDPEDGTRDPSAPGMEALVPEAWKEEGVCKTEPEDLKDEGLESAASLPENHAMESPDIVEVSNTPPSQDLTASPVGSPGSQRLAKKPRLKAPRKSSPLRKEEAPTEETKESVLNSSLDPAPELVGESPAEAAEKESSTGQKDPAKPKAEEAAQSPSLPGEGAGAKGSEQPVEKERKRSERARRSEASRPETVNSSESIPVSDEDSDAMVDDPNDEDFVPCRTRRTTRMSLRNQMAQRAARSTVTKMTCANCRTPLQKGQTAYQRKGLPQLFCSSTCLTTFSKKPLSKKNCTFCKKEIWNTKESVVAQVGSGSSFHEFCTSVCLSLYEAQQQRPAPQTAEASDTVRCSVCYKAGEIQHERRRGSAGLAMARWTLAALALLLAASRRAPRGEMLLSPPRNVTLVSKDFNLFLTWLPGAGYPPGVFYTVQWSNVYHPWEDFLPCRNISATVCNITCTSPDTFHSFDVRVKAQGSAGTISSDWLNLEDIDYEVNVTLAPPALQVRKIGDTVVVNATFSDPLCLNDIFHHLTADVEFWEAGANNRKKFNMKNSKEFDAAIFSGSDYCFSARAVLTNLRSIFSEPTCIQLHSKADPWALAAVPVLLLFILSVCIVHSLYRSRSRPKTVKSPQVLDFSSFKCLKKSLELTEKEFISVLTCPGHPVVVEIRSRLTHSQLVPSVLEEYEEEEEEEDTGSSRPYTEMHRFQKTDIHGLGEKEPDPCSESDSSQLGEGSMPDLMMPGFFVLTNSVFGEVTPRFQGNETTSLSAGFSSEESSVCPDIYPVAQREGQEDSDEGTDLLFQLSDSNLPTRKLLMPSESFRFPTLCAAVGRGTGMKKDKGGFLACASLPPFEDSYMLAGVKEDVVNCHSASLEELDLYPSVLRVAYSLLPSLSPQQTPCEVGGAERALTETALFQEWLCQVYSWQMIVTCMDDLGRKTERATKSRLVDRTG